jgi:glycosyltransferase involved in cell wall biosynthesis
MASQTGNMTLPLVTVIIPTYNYAHLIDQTLESVLVQTYMNWECYVVDDGSTDDTRTVVIRYAEKDDRIKYLRQNNLRAGTARNNGIRNSRGKYLQFLDADDLIESTKLERQVAYLEEHPEVDIVYGDVRYFKSEEAQANLSPTLGEKVTWMPRISGHGREVLLALIRLPIVIHTPLIRKNEDDVIYFDEGLKACEDWLYWVVSALRGKRFHYEEIDGTLSYYRAHTNSACANQPLIDDETRRLRGIINQIVRDEDCRRLNRRLNAEYEGNMGIAALTSGDVWRGMIQFLRAAAKSSGPRVKMKWLFCALASPFTPSQRIEDLVVTPLGKSIGNLLRNRRTGLGIF